MFRFIISSAVLLSAVAAPAQEKATIDWSEDRKLTWNDFSAAVDKQSPNAALTNAGITIDFNYAGTTLNYTVHCRFDKSKSWVRVKRDDILAHEQGHFDIAEIYARKLYKALLGYEPVAKTLNKDVNNIYGGIMQLFHEEEALYDKETNFSIDHEKQLNWLARINTELEGLKKYAVYNSK